MEAQDKYDIFDLFLFLWENKKPIIIVTIFGAIVSIVVSLMLPNYYKSISVLFPTTFISPTTGMLHKNMNQETDPFILGDENDAEKMIQLLKSDFIRNKIITKYDLIRHYGFSLDEKHLKAKINEAYDGNISFNKTSFQGVTISVVDEDPKLASEIANNIANLYDSLITDMQKQRIEETYKIVKDAYDAEGKYISNLEDSLDIYRQYGILAIYPEVERYSEAYAKAIGNNVLTKKGQKFFDDKFNLFKKYGKEVQSLSYFIDELKQNLANLHLNLIQAEQNIKNPITHKYVISYAQPSDKKAYPNRILIVVFSTLGAFILAVTTILFLNFYKDLRNYIIK